MTYTAEGDFEVDSISGMGRTLTKVCLVGIGQSGRIFLPEGKLSLVLYEEGYEAEEVVRRVRSNISLSEPLHGTKYASDTLSLSSATVTRRTEACLLLEFDLDNFSGDYPVFKVELTTPIAKGSGGEFPYFTEVTSLEELKYTPQSFYFDTQSKNGVLYFSGPEDVYSVNDMSYWIYDNYEILGFCYVKAVHTVEEVSLPAPLLLYPGYTLLMLEDTPKSSFAITYYTDEEKGDI